MTKKEIANPFLSARDVELAVLEYEEIRKEGRVNMFALGAFWDKKELFYVMHLYNTGEAQKIIKRMLPAFND